MRIILIFFGAIFILALVGALISLPILLPPLRRLGRRSRARRMTLICLMSLISFMLVFATLTCLHAAVQYAGYITTKPAYATVEMRPFNRAVLRELWLRQMLPPLGPEACYTDQAPVCDLADEVYSLNQWYSYWGLVGFSLVPAGTTAASVWLSLNRLKENNP